jgi:hypothetical protein
MNSPSRDNPEAMNSESAESGSSGFSLVRVFAALTVAAIAAVAAYFILVHESGPPELVAFRGKVLYKGKPLTGGGVFTQPLDPNLVGGVAALESDGSFTLMTNGIPGAYVGTHKLAVSVMSSGSPPTPLIPAAYTEIRSTPLVIQVSTDPAANSAEFTIADPPGK